jgi:3-isopropylmalate/(R)-2-methylmalate dehydratase large subunit
MRILVEEDLLLGCEAKDLVFTLIARIGTAGGTRHVLKYAGSAIRALGMAGETKMCNMSIEAAARGLGRSRRDDLRLT